MTDQSDDRPRLPDAHVLARLDPDPEKAAAFLVKLEGELARFLEWKGCSKPADVASETMSRSFKELFGDRIAPTREGFRRWVFGIAKRVLLEQERAGQRTVQLSPEVPVPALGCSPEDEIHARRLAALAPTLIDKEDWALLQRYSDEDEHEHVAHALELGVRPATLRVRVHRIREKLKKRLAEAERDGKLRIH